MADHLLHHAAIEVSIHKPLSYLRKIATDASPDADHLLSAQRDLLRRAAARLRNKGLSTDTETYRRLGILIPPWRHPGLFEETLLVLRDYWRRHRTASTLGRAAPYRQAREKAAEYLRLLAAFAGADDAENAENIDDNDDAARFAHLLPSTTDVRVFRLVNGNLEVPPTLFKALSTAGRIEDVFFPDEPDTWQMASEEEEEEEPEKEMAGQDALAVGQVQPEVAAAGNYMYQAVQQFMQQMAAGSPRHAAMPPLVILPLPGFMPGPMPAAHPFMPGPANPAPEAPTAPSALARLTAGRASSQQKQGSRKRIRADNEETSVQKRQRPRTETQKYSEGRRQLIRDLLN